MNGKKGRTPECETPTGNGWLSSPRGGGSDSPCHLSGLGCQAQVDPTVCESQGVLDEISSDSCISPSDRQGTPRLSFRHLSALESPRGAAPQ